VITAPKRVLIITDPMPTTSDGDTEVPAECKMPVTTAPAILVANSNN
jgi:hypothetical protein